MEIRLDGKVALVTGGASGIGAAVVTLLMERGASVACVDLNAEASPDGALKVDGDVSRFAALFAMLDQPPGLMFDVLTPGEGRP